MTTARGLRSALARPLAAAPARSWNRKNSSKISRRCAGERKRVQLVDGACSSGGKCASAIAVRRSSEPRRSRTAAGSGSGSVVRQLRAARGARARAASSASASRSSRRRHDAAGVERLVVGVASASSPSSVACGRISYCGFCSCSPCDVSSSLPNRMTRWCGWKTSLRNGWLNQIARSEPVRSRTTQLEDLEARAARRPEAAARRLRRRPRP